MWGSIYSHGVCVSTARQDRYSLYVEKEERSSGARHATVHNSGGVGVGTRTWRARERAILTGHRRPARGAEAA